MRWGSGSTGNWAPFLSGAQSDINTALSKSAYDAGSPLIQQGAGRYVARFPVKKVGTYSVSLLSLDAEGNRRHSVTTGLVVPYSDEFKRLESNRTALEQLAASAGGKVAEPAALSAFEVNPWRREDLGERVALEERWPLALALGLLIFFLDVGIRRVAIDWEKLVARAKASVTRKDAPRTIDRLRERKAQVQHERDETLQRVSAQPGAEHGLIDVAGGGTLGAGAPSPDGAPRPKPKPKPKPQAPSGDEEGGYTNRLLEAKRRARREIDDNQDS